MEEDAELRDLRERVGALEKAVFTGNGRPPLLSRCENVETRVSHMQGDIASIRGNQSWAVRLILGQIAVQVCSWAARFFGGMG